MRFSDIDWNQAAMEIALEREKRDAEDLCSLKGEAFWNMRAPAFTQHAPETGYAESFIKIIKPDKSMTVLDMGCGGGTLAFPMAGLVKEITAVDFSSGMLDVVNQRITEQKIKNIRTIKCSWTENWDAAGIGVYDVAIASRSMAVSNLKEAVTKLANAALKRVYISTVVSDGPHDRGIYEAIGREIRPSIDYIYVYNILYQMGIHANIEFIKESRIHAYKNYDDALASSRWMVQNLTPEEEERLDSYMRAHLVESDEGWVMDYAKKFKWAVLWWEKEI